LTPEAADYLAKARNLLSDAGVMLDVIHLSGHAARTAYLAGFHAAQALIFERTGKIAKTHRGVRNAISRLAENDSRLDRSLARFLGRAYQRKEVADYGVGSSAVITESDAHEMIEGAKKFIAEITEILAQQDNKA
jgi:uncharacterized protein (UPF0332 family)